MAYGRWTVRTGRIAQVVGGMVLGAMASPLASQEVVPRTTDAMSIDRSIEAIRREVGVPGMSIAVVRGDSLIHLRGYGVVQIGTEDTVDGGTAFAIGSATKAFTATLIGMLVDDGLLGWDDLVVDRLPGFVLRDPSVTAQITMRDLLAHRSGLPTANLMWLNGSVDSQTLLQRLRWLEPAAGFRAAFTYQNLLYLAAGQMAEAVTGRRWAELLAQRILAPLGMSRTSTNVGSLTGRGNVATPHVLLDGEVMAVPYRDLAAVAPAGSINSSATDLARWLRFLIAGGVWEGRRLIEAATLTETVNPQIVVPADPAMSAFHPVARLQAYGMGWFISDFHGVTLLAHGGGIDGMSSLVAWVPEAQVGVAILTNLQTPNPAWIYGVLYAVLDPLLEVPPTDWRTPASALDALLTQMTGSGAIPKRVPGARRSIPEGQLVGVYQSPTLGEIRIEAEDGRLALTYGTLHGTLEYWHFNTYRVQWENLAWRSAAGSGWMTFRRGRNGDVEGAELMALPGQTERLNRRE